MLFERKLKIAVHEFISGRDLNLFVYADETKPQPICGKWTPKAQRFAVQTADVNNFRKSSSFMYEVWHGAQE